MMETIIFIIALLTLFVWLATGIAILWILSKAKSHFEEFKTLTPAEIKEVHKLDDEE